MNGIRAFNPADLLAGLSLAGLLLPEAVAYSGLAGLPPQAGVIGLFAGLVCYALIGRSRYAIVTATSSSAAVFAAATLVLGANATGQRIAIGSILVCATGIAFLLAGCARLGAMSNLIARPVLHGFSFGLALVIAVKQWPHIVGMQVHSGDFLPLLAEDRAQNRRLAAGEPGDRHRSIARSVCPFADPIHPGSAGGHRGGYCRSAVARVPRRAAHRPYSPCRGNAVLRIPLREPLVAAGGVRAGADVHPLCGILQRDPHLRDEARRRRAAESRFDRDRRRECRLGRVPWNAGRRGLFRYLGERSGGRAIARSGVVRSGDRGWHSYCCSCPGSNASLSPCSLRSSFMR